MSKYLTLFKYKLFQQLACQLVRRDDMPNLTKCALCPLCDLNISLNSVLFLYHTFGGMGGWGRKEMMASVK